MNRNEDKFYKISLIVCLMIILGQSIYMFIYIKMNKTPDMNTDESGAKALVDNMSFLRPFELRSENYTLSPEIKIMDENGKAWSFKNLLETKKAALIYRFSETHCDLCINQHFEN